MKISSAQVLNIIFQLSSDSVISMMQGLCNEALSWEI